MNVRIMGSILALVLFAAAFGSRPVGVAASNSEQGRLLGAVCKKETDQSVSLCTCGSTITVKAFADSSTGKKDDGSTTCGSGSCVSNVAQLKTDCSGA